MRTGGEHLNSNEKSPKLYLNLADILLKKSNETKYSIKVFEKYVLSDYDHYIQSLSLISLFLHCLILEK